MVKGIAAGVAVVGDHAAGPAHVVGGPGQDQGGRAPDLDIQEVRSPREGPDLAPGQGSLGQNQGNAPGGPGQGHAGIGAGPGADHDIVNPAGNQGQGRRIAVAVLTAHTLGPPLQIILL